MRFALKWPAIFLLFLGTLFPTQAAHTTAILVLDRASAQPGDTITAGILLKMERGWHTYWQNSGDSGIPTSVTWELPPGFTAGAIQWPVPEKLPDADVTTYIYSGEVLLLVPLKLGPDAPIGTARLKAKISWLECKVECVPGDAVVEANLTVGKEAAGTAGAGSALVEKWRKTLPAPGDKLSAKAWWNGAGSAERRQLIIEWKPSSPELKGDFYPFASDRFEVGGPTTVLPTTAGEFRIRKEVKKLEGDWPGKVGGVIVEETSAGKLGYEVSLEVLKSAPDQLPAGNAVSTGGKAVKTGDGERSLPSIWLMLFYAFIGGMILNIMPCVLPVIALKILGFVGQSRDNPRQVRKLGLVYTAGVLFSFVVLAALVIGVKAAGHKAGWGMQFGNPEFLVILTVLVTVVALNLFGLFEVTPGARVMGAAGTLASRHGVAGAFFNGVLATILATPCTAPFLGAALGFAFAPGQSSLTLLLMFLTVGFGLALPYLLLSWEPSWLKFLPKPGAWMERFKVAMGFPMLATAVWLFSLLPIHYGERSWWLGVFLVVVALAAWVFGEFFQRASARRIPGLIVTVLLLTGGYVLVVERQLDWRSPETGATTNPNSVPHESGGVAWQPWSPENVAAARAAGRPVLVDFTAKWCLTCNTVVKPALESASVRAKLAAVNAVALLGDYTRFPPAITDELNRFGRAGVPLVLVFPANPSEPAIVLPEAVTPGMVVEALERATKRG